MKYSDINIGDIVKIRPLEWFINCKENCGDFELFGIGKFVEVMTRYCNMEAKVVNIIYNNVPTYKLDIDDGSWGWQEYMFDPKSILISKISHNICEKKCKNKNCKECILYNIVNNEKYIEVGDNIKIRSTDWFNYNYSIFYKKYKFSEKESRIREIIKKNNYTYYKLDIDNGELNWTDSLFELSYLNNIFRKFCKFGCLYECKKDKCPLFKL